MFGAGSQDPIEDALLCREAAIEAWPCIQTNFPDIARLRQIALEYCEFIFTFGDELWMQSERHTHIRRVQRQVTIPRPRFGCRRDGERRHTFAVALCDQFFVIWVEI
ncbi:hypothetical protein C7405_102208 [Paraburkholderia caballeronis]|nr:hypothetical protein C7405_102208 [Paraburkholderia caballeronis]